MVLTNTMLSLLSPEKRRSTSSRPWGTPDRRPTPLGLFREYLLKQNAEALPLSLGSLDNVPSDCSMLVIAAPQVDLTEREAAILDRYWSSEQGRCSPFSTLRPYHPALPLPGASGVMPMDNRVLCTCAWALPQASCAK